MWSSGFFFLISKYSPSFCLSLVDTVAAYCVPSALGRTCQSSSLVWQSLCECVMCVLTCCPLADSFNFFFLWTGQGRSVCIEIFGCLPVMIICGRLAHLLMMFCDWLADTDSSYQMFFITSLSPPIPPTPCFPLLPPFLPPLLSNPNPVFPYFKKRKEKWCLYPISFERLIVFKHLWGCF